MTKEILIAESAARAAGEYLRRQLQENHSATLKTGIDDVVSVADIESDRIIREALDQTGFNILSEENGYTDKQSTHTWIIDSLDGSANYLNHIPYFGISIGLAENDLPIGGVIYDPINDILYSATKGNGAFANAGQIALSDDNIADGILNTDFGRTEKEQDAAFMAKVANECRYLRVCGSAVLGMMEVIQKHANAYFHFNLKSWDACAAACILEEAGAIVTNSHGAPWKTTDNTFFAGTTKTHARLIELARNTNR
jgi:myo-inositol-1(or 4)-monophosphatase